MAEAVVAVSAQEIEAAVKEITATYRTKMTLRQIYYRLVARNLIPNNLNAYKNLSRILVTARERGRISGNIMEDRGRESYGGDWGYDSPEQFIASKLSGLNGCWGSYTREMWADQDEYIEVWVEKDALSRLVRSATDGYRIKTCVGRGYSSYTYVSDAVDRFVAQAGKQCTVIYVGDFDPSGLDITRDLGRRLSEYGADHVTINRIALTPAQIKQYSLPPAPVKTTDARASKFIAEHGKDVVELDALEPPVLQGIIEAEVLKHIDGAAWAETRERIEEEREVVKTSVQEWLDILSAKGVKIE
jgi:CxxC motif-containing protein/ferritin-like protein